VRYRSKAARFGAALGAGLFSSTSEVKTMPQPDDSQACIGLLFGGGGARWG